jgi:glutaryl-CoA dehydrogenase
MPFKAVDFYRIDDLLTNEEQMVRDTVRRFVDERVIPVIDKHFEDATFPRHLIPQMAELGLLGGNLPEQYGCAGMNNVAYGNPTMRFSASSLKPTRRAFRRPKSNPSSRCALR